MRGAGLYRSSYFIPDPLLRNAVETARTGMDVRILVPGNHTDANPVQHAGRGYYEELLEAGVRIFEYQPSMMHAKTAWRTMRGPSSARPTWTSAAWRSTRRTCSASPRSQVRPRRRRGDRAGLSRSKEIRLDAWRRRPAYQRVLERVALVLIEQY